MHGYERHPHLATIVLEQCLVRELHGLIAMADGRLDEALKTFQEVAHVADNSLRIESEWFAAHFRVDEGQCLVKLNRFDEAEKVLHDACAVLTQRLGDRHYRTQNAIRALLEVYEKTGDPRAEQWRSKKLRASKCES